MREGWVQHLEKAHDKPLKRILIELYQEEGTQRGVAARLGVSQGTVSLWMKFCGLEIQTENRIVEVGNG